MMATTGTTGSALEEEDLQERWLYQTRRTLTADVPAHAHAHARKFI